MVWESTGLYGESALCRYQLGAGQVEQRTALAAELFGEGICRVDDVIWQRSRHWARDTGLATLGSRHWARDTGLATPCDLQHRTPDTG